MKKKLVLVLLGIMPLMFLFFTGNSVVAQGEIQNKDNSVAPMFFSYTRNGLINNDEVLLLEYWMFTCDDFQSTREDCCFLEDWMLNKAIVLSYEEEDLESWMMYEQIDPEFFGCAMREWMFGFEPFVESSLCDAESAPGIEDWMLEFNAKTQKFIIDAFISLKDWMYSTSFDEHENYLDLEDWMMEALTIN